jgi:hypothetical protein
MIGMECPTKTPIRKETSLRTIIFPERELMNSFSLVCEIPSRKGAAELERDY